jgi:hypothetical protein
LIIEGGLKGTTINKETQIMQEMQKLKNKALKLKKYYDKKQKKDNDDFEERVVRLELKFEKLKNHNSGSAEGWLNESSIYSHSDLYIESNKNMEDEEQKRMKSSAQQENKRPVDHQNTDIKYFFDQAFQDSENIKA